ncbi:MAG: L,D-transpeptidase [Victivallales bacterium]
MKIIFIFLFCLGIAFSTMGENGFTKGTEIEPLPSELNPGEYVWLPEISPKGPVVVIVSIPAQEIYVYRNGVRIGRSTVSTGTKEHSTPTGIFTILQKKVDYESSIYKGAKMPYMERLTWDGIALHAGKLPGYPASHGCVRLSEEFAEKLYSVTSNSTTVIVTDQKFAPGKTASPGLLLSGTTGEARSGNLPYTGFEWEPDKAPEGAVSIIFSIPDSVAYVYRNSVQIGRVSFVLDKKVEISGSHVYTALDSVDLTGPRAWLAISSIGGEESPDVKDLADFTRIPPKFLEKARSVITAGTMLIITDLPVSSQTRSEGDFSIMTDDQAKPQSQKSK